MIPDPKGRVSAKREAGFRKDHAQTKRQSATRFAGLGFAAIALL
jgi:hypothetical protein